MSVEQFVLSHTVKIIVILTIKDCDNCDNFTVKNTVKFTVFESEKEQLIV